MIDKIAYKLNDLAKKGNYNISKLPQIRKDIKNKKILPDVIFSDKTIFLDEAYAYHHGGRSELQFNIGFEEINGNTYFRYCIALSFEPSPSLHDPKGVLKPKFDLLNLSIIEEPDLYKELKFWVFTGNFSNRKRSKNQIVKEIPDEIAEIPNFLAIGKIVDYKENKLLSENFLKRVLVFFDKMLPVYEKIENIRHKNIIENKTARICWNDKDWIQPSGIKGKSKSKSFENDNGYGFEEWLFDSSKEIEGYHYGFIEPIHKFRSKYEGRTYNISLFSINGENKQRYWIGILNNVEVINQRKSLEVIDEYKKRGWYDEMINQIKELKLCTKEFNKWAKKGIIFNVRFKVTEIFNLPAIKIPFDHDNKFIKSSRYNLFNVNINALNELTSIEHATFNFNNSGSCQAELKTKTKKTTSSKDTEVELLHNELQMSFLDFLQKRYGYDNVKRECRAWGGAKVDIVRKTKTGYVFYEIKTYNNILTSLRYSIGQLLEYCFYPDIENQNAEKLVLVSQINANEIIKKYISKLKTLINIPIGYIQFDSKMNKIVEEI